MSIEAMKLALEALEQLQGGCTDSDDGTVEAITVWCPEVIDALRQAIEQADQAHAIDTSQERVDEMVKTEHDKQIEIAQAYERGWNAALAQQEPVAWMGAHDKTDLYYRKPPQADVIPLYTTPPQRKPLTEEHIIGLWQHTKEPDGHRIERFARAIEAAHGIGEKE